MVRYTRKGLLKGEGNMEFLTGKTAIITGAGRADVDLSDMESQLHMQKRGQILLLQDVMCRN